MTAQLVPTTTRLGTDMWAEGLTRINKVRAAQAQQEWLKDFRERRAAEEARTPAQKAA